MEQILITVGSVTTAARFKKLLYERAKIKAEIIHTPAALNCGGCSYSLRCKRENAAEVQALANEIGFKIKGIYEEKLSIKGECQYNALS